MTLSSTFRLPLALAPLLALGACQKAPPEPIQAESTSNASSPGKAAADKTNAGLLKAGGSAEGDLGGSAKKSAKLAKSLPHEDKPSNPQAPQVAKVRVSPDDPMHGKFKLAQATKGLKGKGQLLADIVTDKGKLTCKLYDKRAPITVANFVGLARGIRPWKNPDGKWVKKPAYDGTTFHRIIKGFMIQGGDPAGNGTGEPGYVIPDEIWKGATHDTEGQLCMANRGPNTNGQQFFIMDGSAKHLDGGYTIFGMCTPDKVIDALASVRVVGDRAANPPAIKKVVIRRGKP